MGSNSSQGATAFPREGMGGQEQEKEFTLLSGGCPPPNLKHISSSPNPPKLFTGTETCQSESEGYGVWPGPRLSTCLSFPISLRVSAWHVIADLLTVIAPVHPVN